MNHTTKLTHQSLNTTWLALHHIQNDHRITPEQRAAIGRVLLIITELWLAAHNHHQDLHP